MSPRLCIDTLLLCLERAQARSGAHGPVLASCSQPWQTLDPLTLFAANREHLQPACLWQQPAHDEYRVGLGQAFELNGIDTATWPSLQARWQAIAASAEVQGGHRPTLLGGFAFDRHKARTRLWRDFPDAALTLPRFELRQAAGQTTLVINALVNTHSDCRHLAWSLAREWAQALDRPAPRTLPARAPYQRQPLPHLWTQDVRNAVHTLRHGDLDKVVLARCQALHVREPVQRILARLGERQPNAYLFAFARGRSCFLGATPERLLRVKQRTLHTMALAGTAPRGGDSEEDIRLGAQLLASLKDNAEHQMVVASLRQHLAPCCTALEIASRAQLHRLPNVQHLLTPVQGELKPGMGLLEVLERLHPTPAVGGLPRQQALAYIRQCEQLDRGWYAGPVGWLDDQGDGEFAVALRCALLKGDQATLFAGCGLVSGSDPDSEYRESVLKMRTMQEALMPGSPVSSALGPASLPRSG
ncbi:isochorismate synthase [Pseudomonas entomophila]|uniref:isochorismate synthase n=1 Tax=Pseudomonas entomophila TaxID=312306 RepID=UPI0023D7B881|nr:isochorismate synthase [Pseudomonas entomophila]MDF0732200.1 isochorismate synthase [Pseudomonas entomophila]